MFRLAHARNFVAARAQIVPLAGLALALGLGGPAARGQDGPPLVGTLKGNIYTSATGAFQIVSPVSPDLGGVIVDTPNVVTFEDSFTTFVTIVAFQLDATQKWEMDTANSRRDYLISFFTEHVLPDFRSSFPSVQVEPTGRFLPGMLDGAFLVYLLIPGGSMFAHPELQIAAETKPPVAKRGNLLFVRNGYIFVVSTELAERITEGSAYHQTSDQEDQILRDRLIDIVTRMHFLAPAGAGAAAGH